MSEFLEWHPSSSNADKLYAQRDKIINAILINPINAIKSLEQDWNFGKISELWDDYIFDNIIRPALQVNQTHDLTTAINRFSSINHSLFLPYIRREEDPVRFRRAFWNVNSFGLRLSTKLFGQIPNASKSLHLESQPPANFKKIAFILKGPYRLAHTEFLQNFLMGCNIFAKDIQVHLILIDELNINESSLEHVSIHKLGNILSTSKKLDKYIHLCNLENFCHICWVACVQDLTLYMGMQLAPVQSYWSMKYHSIIMPTIQKYAGLGFGGDSFVFDDVHWYRGRAFPELSMPSLSKSDINNLRSSKKITSKSIVIGCFVRGEKLFDKSFWDSIVQILRFSQNVHFIIASQFLPSGLSSLIDSCMSTEKLRFHHLGWVNTKNWSHALDIYYDSSPRGSCNTIFEAIEANVPVLMADSDHNRESSAFPYLASAAKVLNLSDNSFGVYDEESDRLEACKQLISSLDSRSELARNQSKLLKFLKGRNCLFSKDYLNYFLDENLTLAGR